MSAGTQRGFSWRVQKQISGSGLDPAQFQTQFHSGQSITARQMLERRQSLRASHVHTEFQCKLWTSWAATWSQNKLYGINTRASFFFFFFNYRYLFLHASSDTRSGIHCVASESRALAGTRPVRTDALLQILLFPAYLFPKGEAILLQEATSIVRST